MDSVSWWQEPMLSLCKDLRFPCNTIFSKPRWFSSNPAIYKIYNPDNLSSHKNYAILSLVSFGQWEKFKTLNFFRESKYLISCKAWSLILRPYKWSYVIADWAYGDCVMYLIAKSDNLEHFEMLILWTLIPHSMSYLNSSSFNVQFDKFSKGRMN